MKRNYKCGWCSFEFSRDAFYSDGGMSPTGKKQKKQCISNQIKCPACSNLIPTWKKEETGNIIGRKHIHLNRG